MAGNNKRTRSSTKKSRQRERLILALLQQPSLEKAATSMGISAVTAWRITKTPEFEEEYRQARYEAAAQSFGRLNQGTGAAATVLLKIMLDPANSAASRVHAADRVIQHSKSHLELEDFELRLRRLEQVAAEKKDAAPPESTEDLGRTRPRSAK